MRKYIMLILALLSMRNVNAQFRVSANHHFILKDNKPFFWLGDTAWELFARLNREEADFYLKTRSSQGFTVIQAVLLAEFDGLHTPNAYGDKPLIDDDPTKPNEKYFEQVDYIIDKAEQYHLNIALLPTSGDKVYKPDSCAPLKVAHQNHLIGLEALSRLKYPGKPIEIGTLKGIASIGSWNAIQDQSWGLDWHRNEGIEIGFLETGQLPFLINNTKYILQPDNLTITRPWQPHKVGDPNVTIGKLHWLIIDVGVRNPHQEWKWRTG